MADWGSFLRGLSQSTRQLPELMIQLEALVERRKQKEIETDMKSIEMLSTIINDDKDIYADSAKVMAYNKRNELMGKRFGVNADPIQEWDKGYKDLSLKMRNTVAGFTSGAIDYDDASTNLKLLNDDIRARFKDKGKVAGADSIQKDFNKQALAMGGSMKSLKDQDVFNIPLGQRQMPSGKTAAVLTEPQGQFQPFSPEQKQMIASNLSDTEQKAFGIGNDTGTLENILADKVRSGEMTLEQAYKTRKQHEETINDYNVFYRGYKEKNPNATEAEISQAWFERQKVLVDARIPVFGQATQGIPPGYVFNRRTGGYDWKGEGPAPGMTPEDVATYQADKWSLKNQQKIRDMMGGFVRNMNKQINRVNQVSKDLVKRVGVRAIDLPIRELNTRFIGSGNEKILEAYMVEISNEIGKLSTGSSASIRELSVDAQERWAKIHDPNLSIRELGKILKETKDMGNMRLSSSDEEIAAAKERMRKGGKSDKTQQETPMSGAVKSSTDFLKKYGR